MVMERAPQWAWPSNRETYHRATRTDLPALGTEKISQDERFKPYSNYNWRKLIFRTQARAKWWELLVLSPEPVVLLSTIVCIPTPRPLPQTLLAWMGAGWATFMLPLCVESRDRSSVRANTLHLNAAEAASWLPPTEKHACHMSSRKERE